MRPRLLDLFCGAGGASMGYSHAGFEVVGVDINPQKHYPFEFIQADVMDFMPWDLARFDVIHASPPCQRYSLASRRWNGRAEEHPDLVAPVRDKLLASGRPWVVENVPGAPLRDPMILCGSMFPGLGVRRHRLFESSIGLKAPGPCAHLSMPKIYKIYDHGRWYMSRVAHVHGHGGGKSKGDWPLAMGINWMDNRELAQAIPPAYTEWIGAQLMDALR